MARANHVAIVADENALCGAGLVHMMESCLGFPSVLTCENFAEVVGIFRQYQSSVALVVIHYDLPGMNRTQGIRQLREAWPSVRVLVTANGGDRDIILEVLSAGSHGFIPKSSSTVELEHALRETAAGHVFVLPKSVDRAPESHPRTSIKEAKLTERQKQVLDLVAAGKSNKQIAWTLGISEGTVKVHVNASFRALDVHNRVNATTALLAHRELAEVRK